MNDLLFDFLNVTESASIAVKPWIGRGDKNNADDAATEAMRTNLNTLDIDAIVVIGEGELDNAPMLFIGEELGTKNGPKLDIVVDPLDGTTSIATGQGNSISVIAVAPEGKILHAPDMYMEKISVGHNAAGKIDINASIKENIISVANALEKNISEITVMIQDRERHKELIEDTIQIGARVELFADVDVISAISPAINGSGIDIFVGIGGAPEGVISAVAIKCLGGEIQGRLLPNNNKEKARCMQMGIIDLKTILFTEDIVKSDMCYFSATGITSGKLLKGVKQLKDNVFQTHSLITSGKSGRAFFVESNISLE